MRSAHSVAARASAIPTPDAIRRDPTNPLELGVGSRVRLLREQGPHRAGTILVVTRAWEVVSFAGISYIRVALATVEAWDSGEAYKAYYAPLCADADSLSLSLASI